MAYGYVYKTVNKKNGRMYIGQRRGSFDPKYFGSGLLIRKAISKYGKSSFTVAVLSYGLSKVEVDVLEKAMIQKYREILGRRKLYNLQDGGQPSSGMVRKSHSTKTKKLMCKNHLNVVGSRNPMFGKKQSVHQRLQVAKYFLGTKWMHKGSTNKHVLASSANSYLKKGWTFGLVQLKNKEEE